MTGNQGMGERKSGAVWEVNASITEIAGQALDTLIADMLRHVTST